MTSNTCGNGVPAPSRCPLDTQSIDAPLTSSSIFLVITVQDNPAALNQVCETLNGVDDLVKTVGFRDMDAKLSCVVGLGSGLWDRVSPQTKPKELKPFTPIQGAKHNAPSTPGDVLFHIRASRLDMCFELERLLLVKMGAGNFTVVDEVQGFRYFDARDLLGFIDGTANPVGGDMAEATLVADEDPQFCGGSYVVVQKYLHDLAGWSELKTEMQETIIGRTKFDNVELDDDDAPRKSHKTLCTITDEQGEELDILRDNMPFGRAGEGEFGTYFIGYSRRLWVIEKMLQRMFVGEPAGAYDRILDFSTAKTGVTFFAPTRTMLEAITDFAAQ